MAEWKEPETPERSPEEHRAFLHLFKRKLAMGSAPWDDPADRWDWATEVRPELVEMVGAEVADRLIADEMAKEADEFRRRAETEPRGPFGTT